MYEFHFRISCPDANCLWTFSNVKGLKNHLYQIHKNFCFSTKNDLEKDANNDLSPSTKDFTNTNCGDDLISDEVTNEDVVDDGMIDLQRSDDIDDAKDKFIVEMGEDLLKFHLTATHVYNLPERVANDLTDIIDTLIRKQSRNLCEIFHQFPDFHETSSDFVCNIPSIDISKQKLDSLLKNRYGFKPPIQMQCFDESYSYIPISFYLFNNFVNDDVKLNKNVTFCKSNYYNEHIKPCLSSDDNVIRIMLYSDEFELCNPIGVARGNHKCLAVYCKVINFHEKHLSKESCHYLLLLVKCSVLKKSSLHEIFSPLIKELNELYFEGIVLNDVKYYVIACFMTGDNLSSNFIGGFTTSFSNSHFCRFCSINTRDVFSSFDSDVYDTRTHDSIECDVENSVNGMKFLSPFLNLPYVKLPYFLPPDMMHDIFEGVSHLIFGTVFAEMLKLTDVTIDVINSILKYNLPFSPQKITVTHLRSKHFPFTASQMCYLLQFLPSMFGCFFSEESIHWLLLLTHCEIVEIVSSPYVEEKYIPHLKYLIMYQNSILKELYPESCKYKCKIHNMTHYPSLLKKYGSLSMFSCMRFEAVHRYFKRLMKKINQYKNVTMLLSNRYLRRHCALNAFQKNASIVTYQLYKTFSVEELDFGMRQSFVNFGISVSCGEFLQSVNKLTYEGYNYFCYKKHTVIVSGVNYEYNPIFWIIVHIFSISRQWIFILQRLECSSEPHFKSYIINKRLQEYKCVSPGSEFHPPLEVKMLGGFQAISLKHTIM